MRLKRFSSKVVHSLGKSQYSASLPPPILRPVQKLFITELYSHIRAGNKRVLAVAATGFGKTVVASQIVLDAVFKGRRVLFVVHRDVLIAQTYEKLCKFGVTTCGFIKAGWPEQRDCLVQIASVQTLSKRDWWHQFSADVVLLDEAHIVAYSSVVQMMMNQIYPQAVYIGLTGTPFRLNKHEGMGDVFEALACAPMPHALIDQGYLVKPSYFSVEQTDLKKVTIVDGDFDEGELAIVCDRPELIQQIVQKWKTLAYGRRTIAFAVNVIHSQHLCEAFQAAGVRAAHVDGSTPVKVRNQIYQKLVDGEILVLSSCQVLTEGFDVCSVSAVLLCRPTASKALHFQMIGRGLRLSPETNKRDLVVIDQAGNIAHRHGYVEDLKEISLNYGQSHQDFVAPKKICPLEDGGCSAILYAFQMRCPNCGYAFPQPKKVYFIPELQQQLSESDFERYEFYRQKIREAYQQNFAPGWAAMTFKERYGHWPPDSWALGAIFGLSPTASQEKSYHRYLQAVAKRKEKSESWVERYMNVEFGFREIARMIAYN